MSLLHGKTYAKISNRDSDGFVMIDILFYFKSLFYLLICCTKVRLERGSIFYVTKVSNAVVGASVVFCSYYFVFCENVRNWKLRQLYYFRRSDRMSDTPRERRIGSPNYQLACLPGYVMCVLYTGRGVCAFIVPLGRSLGLPKRCGTVYRRP